MLLVVLSGCSEETKDQWKRLGLPEPASDRTQYIHDLWIGAWIAAGIIGLFVIGLILWASVRYRHRSSSQIPVQTRYNLPIEVLYTVAPVIAVVVLFFFTVEQQNNVLEPVDQPDHRVTVTGQQWSWSFSYIEEPAVDGQTVHESGTPADIPELWLVKDQSVTFDLHSPDVIHSFWVPSFYFKRDVIPGRSSEFSLTPNEYGTFQGRCAELCGTLHSRMLFTVHVVDQDEFDAHLQELADAGQFGELLGGENVDEVTGLEGQDEGGEGE